MAWKLHYGPTKGISTIQNYPKVLTKNEISIVRSFEDDIKKYVDTSGTPVDLTNVPNEEDINKLSLYYALSLLKEDITLHKRLYSFYAIIYSLLVRLIHITET